jgi:hypothetical protein
VIDGESWLASSILERTFIVVLQSICTRRLELLRLGIVWLQEIDFMCYCIEVFINTNQSQVGKGLYGPATIQDNVGKEGEATRSGKEVSRSIMAAKGRCHV